MRTHRIVADATAAVALLTLLAGAESQGALLDFTGTFHGLASDDYWSGTETFPISGSFGFLVSEEWFGNEDEVFDLHLQFLALDPNPIGQTFFNIDNSHVRFYYVAGGRSSIELGGFEPQFLSSITDDWQVYVQLPGGDPSVPAWIGVARTGLGQLWDYQHPNVQVFITRRNHVPEPDVGFASVLAVIGIAGAARASRYRNAPPPLSGPS